MVANDQMALGVLSALAQLNRSGSRAVSVTGYDDTADSLYFQPPLTTVAQDFDLLGKRAVERLIALMAAPQLRIRELLPTRLIVRQSAWPAAVAEDQQQTLAQLESAGGKTLAQAVEALLRLTLLTSSSNVERSGLSVCEKCKTQSIHASIDLPPVIWRFFLPSPASTVFFRSPFRLAYPAAAC